MNVTLPDFSHARVLVVGDLMLDRYWHGATSRISPEAPVPVVKVGQHEERPGGAANVALNVASLGGKVTLIGLVGKDESATILSRMLATAGVNCQFEIAEDRPTITKLRVISRQQQLIRLDFEDEFDPSHAQQIVERFRHALSGINAIILSDYGKGALRESSLLIELARKSGIPVLVDPKSKDFAAYRGASIITPNMAEFETVVGECKDEATIVHKGVALIERLGLEALLVTRSEKGMSLIHRDGAALHLPTHAREVYDVTGAGDTVISVLGAALACHVPMEEATSLANVAAGIVVGKLGTATVSETELRSALKLDQEHDLGVVDENTLAAAVADAHARGEKIVMTNGCFDILHAGHVSYLEAARRLGDRLIVAVNDDDSVRRLKGENRPINGVEQRMAVLAGLTSTDWVVPFSEDTPERVICRIKPDVLVKGGDYRAEDVAGYECVTRNGGEVKILHFVDGCSTSNVIKRIRDTTK